MAYLGRKTIPFEDVMRLIKGYYSAPELAFILNCSAPTARRKLNTPELLTLGDLERVCRKGHIEADRIRESIKL